MTSETEASTKIFDLLEEGRPIASLDMRESDVVVPAGRVAHAIDQAGRRMLLIPRAENEVRQEDRDSQGVSLETRELVDAGISRNFFVLRCELPSLNDLFSVLCDEVIGELATSDGDPGSTCVRLLDRWRDLLGPRRSALLSASALLGLLVELRFLARMAAHVAPADAIEMWTGPSKARYDFTAPHTAVEVKGTTGRGRFIVEIHGLTQLEAAEGRALFLWAEQLERVPQGGASVPDAIDDLVAAGFSARRLWEQLSGVGYAPTDNDAYRAVRFAPLAWRGYRVTPEFPRIVRSSFADLALADMVFDVKYSIDLSDGPSIAGCLDGPDDIVDTMFGDQ